MLTVPPRFTPGEVSPFFTCSGTLTRMVASLPSRRKVDMQRMILDRIEMIVARDHTVLATIELDLEDRCQEVAGEDALTQFLVADRDQGRGLVVAVDHARHAAGATFCPSGPLAGLRASGRLQVMDGRHWFVLMGSIEKAAMRPY
jgi:hypothetical protein